MKIQDLPLWFQPTDRYKYPIDNWPDFETWFFQNCQDIDHLTDRTYLPILWTSYFKNNGYGKNASALNALQTFIDSLPADGKYFTIVQYDDGTLVDWRGKDVMIFAMSGKPAGCVPIPLVCQPHKYSFKGKKDIRISFVGKITDPSRRKIMDWGARQLSGVYIESQPHSLEKYCEILARSEFVLCPRGYGASSFRISEAWQYGAVPIIFHHVPDIIFPCPGGIIYSYDDYQNLDLDFFVKEKDWMKWTYDKTNFSASCDLYSFSGVKHIIKKSLCQIP